MYVLSELHGIEFDFTILHIYSFIYVKYTYTCPYVCIYTYEIIGALGEVL